MAGAHGGSVERDDAAALKDAVEDGFAEVGVVQDAPPQLERLVGGEDHGATAAVAVVDDMEEDVGGVGTVGETADLIAGRQLGPDVSGERVTKKAMASRGREGLDQIVGGGDESVVAVEDGLVGDGAGERGPAAPAAPLKSLWFTCLCRRRRSAASQGGPSMGLREFLDHFRAGSSPEAQQAPDRIRKTAPSSPERRMAGGRSS